MSALSSDKVTFIDLLELQRNEGEKASNDNEYKMLGGMKFSTKSVQVRCEERVSKVPGKG